MAEKIVDTRLLYYKNCALAIERINNILDSINNAQKFIEDGEYTDTFYVKGHTFTFTEETKNDTIIEQIYMNAESGSLKYVEDLVSLYEDGIISSSDLKNKITDAADMPKQIVKYIKDKSGEKFLFVEREEIDKYVNNHQDKYIDECYKIQDEAIISICIDDMQNDCEEI